MKAKGRGCLFLAALVVASCDAASSDPVPSLPSHRSLLLIRQDNEQLRIEAYALGTPEASELEIDAGGTLAAHLYDQSLEDLGLRPGPVPLAPEGILSHRLPAPSAVHVLVPRASRAGNTWDERPAPLEPMQSLWVAGTPPVRSECPEITIKEFGLSREAWISVAETIGGDRVLVGTATGAWFIASRDRLERFDGFERDVPFGGSHQAPDGTIWLAGCVDEPLRRVTVEGGTPRAEPGEYCDIGSWTGDGRANVRMEGYEGDEDFEIVTMSRAGRVVRHTSDRTEELLDIRRGLIFEWTMYVAPGEAIVTEIQPEVKWVTEPQVFESVTPVWAEAGPQPNIYRAFRAPGGVWLTGYERATDAVIFFWERSTDTWRVVGRPTIGATLYGLAPTNDGFVFAGGNAKVGWWTPDTGFCAADSEGPIGADGEPAWNVRLYQFYVTVVVNDNEMFVAGFEAGIRPTARVWWVRRSP